MKSWGLICTHICWIFFSSSIAEAAKLVWQEVKPFNISLARMEPQFDSLLMVTMWSSLNDNHVIAEQNGFIFVEREKFTEKDIWNLDIKAHDVRFYTDG